MGFLGAVTLLNSCVIVPWDSEYDLAAQKLVEAGFRPAPWTYAITDPQRVRDDEIDRRTLLREANGDGNLDANSLRFQFPAGFSGPERVLLLRSTYIGIRPPSDPESIQRFSCIDNLYFVKTLLQETLGSWRYLLQAWAVAYTYGMLMVEDTVLDSCDDESVKLWLNKKIRRGNGGLDRIAVSKRAGKFRAPTN
ncbi:hypothetical protein HBH98_074630 [Parastagonospora nodorum]|nr:hypothetical protein HBH46_114560 [Parastagonospora nodorum]KAH4194321.1 hypothetical protein HBH42_095800 [Parastagonospora nodorum]KAH4348960.1 hypothetical protein HBH98_074630 [Parastagonospora nodorum]KAH4381405.1 hypothetical protein HBH99_192280 [Parastagonospora nodorum]KAH4391883.1 hypothetical protein HBH97_042280 [Parastagonospora nodorum]